MSTETTTVSSYQDLVRLLAEDGVPHQTLPEEHSVYVPTEHKGREGVQLIRWQEGDRVVQFIQSMPIEVPPDRIAAVESAVTRLNHALSWSGLDLNHDTRSVAYRLFLPLVPRGSVYPEEIKTCFRVAVQTAANLVPTLQRIVSGELAPADVVADGGKVLPAAAGPGPR